MVEETMISVIIPTYNRIDSLRQVLQALVAQTLPDFEVIVVDDGSTDATLAPAEAAACPFELTCLRQENQGATAARNFGAQRSRGDLLVFMDDDIELLPHTLATLAARHAAHPHAIVVGTLLPPVEHRGAGAALHSIKSGGDAAIPFTECFTGLLSVRRDDFFALDMFQDPTGGWPNWDDVDFGYRAVKAGFALLRSEQAQAIHHDAAALNLQNASRRWYRAGQSAVRLLQKYPEIRPHLPMFFDKTPIEWGQDAPGLVLKKLLRRVAVTSVVMMSLEFVVSVVEAVAPNSRALQKLYIWVNGGYMYRGFRAGLEAYGPLPASDRARQNNLQDLE